MKLVKPEPLIIGNRAHYTLSSYDPVSIEVRVPYITDADVDLSLAAMAQEAGGTMADLDDDAWVQENFEGVSNLEELRRNAYDELRAMAAMIAENEKATQCANKLAERLQQSVPQTTIERYRRMAEQTFRAQLAAGSMSFEEFIAASGTRPDDLERMFDAEALSAAESEAALDAWAEYHHLKVSDEELPQLLGLDPSEAEQYLRQASAAGELQSVRQAALRAKAIGMVVSECSCTYSHETPQEAAARNREMLEQRQALFDQANEDPEPSGSSAHPHLRLV